MLSLFVVVFCLVSCGPFSSAHNPGVTKSLFMDALYECLRYVGAWSNCLDMLKFLSGFGNRNCSTSASFYCNS